MSKPLLLDKRQVKALKTGDLIEIDFTQFRRMKDSQVGQFLFLSHCKVTDFISGKTARGVELVALTTERKCYLTYEHLCGLWTTRLVSRI